MAWYLHAGKFSFQLSKTDLKVTLEFLVVSVLLIGKCTEMFTSKEKIII